jgi:glycosyltransferase involved in cell wall biosynthesis
MKNILIIVSEDWYFVSHRLHIAVKAIEKGFTVTLLTRVSKHKNLIESLGIQVIDWSFTRGWGNIFGSVKSIVYIMRAIKHSNSNIIYAVAIKPIIFSSLAAALSGIKNKVYTLGGVGFIFSSNRVSARIIRPVLINVLRRALKGNKTRLILQNKDDREMLLGYKIIENERIILIHGSGVDTDKFFPRKLQKNSKNVILPARMLWDKGVSEFVSCAQQLKENGINARFCLVGGVDIQNPESVSVAQLKKWTDQKAVEWLGHQNNMPEIYSQSTIVCFPSYREGFPKSLLEAASSGLPIVTYDVPGCRDIVTHGVNGFLIPFKDDNALREAILKLIKDQDLCDSMGLLGREIVLKNFSQKIISKQTISVWLEVLDIQY